MADRENELDRVRHEKYGELPARIRPEQMVEEQPASEPRDPDGGRNPENEFMLRYSS